MKRFLHFFVLMVMGLTLFAASPEVFTVTGVKTSSEATQKTDTDLLPNTNGIVWHATSTTNCYSKTDGGCAHLGSGSSQFNGTIALNKTTIPQNATITKIELTGHCAKNSSIYTISASVGGASLGEKQQWKQGSTTNDQTMIFEGSTVLSEISDKDNIVLTFNASKDGYIYIKGISVYYTEQAGPTPLAAPVITFDNTAKQFSIGSVAGGAVYYTVNQSPTAVAADCVTLYANPVAYLTEDGTYYVHAYAKANEAAVNSDSPVATESYTVTGGTVPPAKIEVTLSWSATEATATSGEGFTPPIISYSPDNKDIAGSIAYTSSNEAVAKFDADGQLQILAAGTTVISAKIPDDNATFVSNTATYTLTVKAKPVVDPSVPGKWVLVKSDADVEANARYIVVGDKDAIATTNKSDNRPTETVTISGETITNPSDKVMTFLLLKDGNDYIWQAENYEASSGGIESEAYLYSVTTNKNYLKCGKPQTADMSHRNTSISISSSSHQATIKFVNCNNRVIRHNPNSGNAIFGTYTSTTGSLVYLYKFVEDKKEPQAYDPHFPAELPMRVGDTHALTLGETHPEVIFTVEGNAVEVSADGVVTAKVAGEAKVKAAWNATDDWTEGSATIAVTVKEALRDPMVSFLHDEVVGMLNVGIVAQAAYHESDGEITYSSSNESVVKVNPRTGMITPADVIAVGEAVITAVIAGTDTYKAATASYNVRIENPEFVPLVDAGPALFDFRLEGCYGFKTNETSTIEQTYELDMPDPVTTITENNVTLTFDAESGSQYRSFQGSGAVNQLRIYAGAKFNFSVPEGFAIAKIVFNQIKSSNGCEVTEDVAEGAEALGVIIDGAADPTDSETKSSREWVANEGQSPATVNFVMSSSSGHVRIRTISVVIKKEGSDRKLPGLAFDNRIYNTTEGVKTIVNSATKQTTEDVAITYAIDNLTNADYTIFEDGHGQLEVTVNTPGVYTLRAKSAPTPTLLTGVTILRLNVFPALGLTASNLQDEGETYLLLAPEGGTVNFSEVPSTVKIHYSVDEAAEEKVFDGNDIEAKADATYHYWMQYAETYNSAPQTMHVLLRPAMPEMTQEGKTYTFAVANPADALYYKLTEPASGVNMLPAVDLDGWTKAENGTFTYTLPEGMADDQSVSVAVKAVKQSDRINAPVESDVNSYIIYGNGVTTSIDTVEAGVCQDTVPEYFTLQGVRVGRPAAGQVYIVRRGAEVTKVLVK